ncbi:MAG: VWA domain-containing protein, partial [Fidelibacterota bacterium]
YVTLLPYANGVVSYTYPNNYDLIQSEPLYAQNFIFRINSQRTIESLDMLNHTATEYANDGYFASVEYGAYEISADMDYKIEYQLSLEELGLFGLSTFLPDSTVPDQGNRGFFAFIAEPDPDDNTEVIEKVFTLIIDCSGSMKGEKMTQAKNAADFIVNNLNDGDKFNICNFSTEVSFFKESHVDYTSINKNEALSYIDKLAANGWTNISGALTETIMQYSEVSDNTANIIIFFTDGEPTMGLTETDDILSEVEKYKADLQAPLSLFTFGIGSSVNQQLLSLLATDNNGLVEYLGDDEIEERITSFYSIIKNPVLLETEVSFQPAVISDVHPEKLPNLYQGQQMLVTGRYNEPGNIGISLDGQAYSLPINYQYSLQLVDTNDVNKLFLPKVWAKMTIEDLLVEYYNYDEDSQEAEDIKNQMIDISEDFGVLSPFTKFSGGDPQTDIDEENEIEQTIPRDFHLLGNSPNPFNPSTSIQFFVDNNIHKIAKVKIYNSLGQLVRTLALQVNGAGRYSVFWDGRLMDGTIAPTGAYIYVIELNNTILSGKMTLMK